MGRPRVHADDAARQAAYRVRRRAEGISRPQGPFTVQAPFTVVGRAGHPILEVTDESEGPTLRLYDAQGRLAVTVAALDFGGMVSLNEGDHAGVVVLYSENGVGKVDLRE